MFSFPPLTPAVPGGGSHAETIGSDAFLPTADVSLLGSGESSSLGAAVEIEELPQNGVLWNLDRIVRPALGFI
jgi:hypothetical protein